MLRAEKHQIVDDLHQVFASAGVVVVTHYKGLSVAEITDLRSRMRESGASYRVTKNTLAQRSVEGTSYAALGELFDGPTAIGFSQDPTAAPKVLTAYAKKSDKLKIIGGGLAGALLDEAAVRALAELPSIDELRARIVGMINTPATRLVGLLQAPAGQLARVLAAKAEAGNS